MRACPSLLRNAMMKPRFVCCVHVHYLHDCCCCWCCVDFIFSSCISSVLYTRCMCRVHCGCRCRLKINAIAEKHTHTHTTRSFRFIKMRICCCSRALLLMVMCSLPGCIFKWTFSQLHLSLRRGRVHAMHAIAKCIMSMCVCVWTISVENVKKPRFLGSQRDISAQMNALCTYYTQHWTMLKLQTQHDCLSNMPTHTHTRARSGAHRKSAPMHIAHAHTNI